MAYAKSADPDQTAPQGAVFAIPIRILRNIPLYLISSEGKGE